jgi:hypothetical protein
MRPKLLTLATAASVFLSVVLLVMWARSCYRTDVLAVFRSGRSALFASAQGRMYGVWIAPIDFVPSVRWVSYDQGRWPHLFWPVEQAMKGRISDAGFALTHGTFQPNVTPRPMSDLFVSVPYWFALLFAAGIPGVRGLGWLRRRLRGGPRVGFCAMCGYDLRGTPNRCPECGAIPEPRTLPVA